MRIKQTIVTWYEPDEKMPPEGESVVVSISGKAGNITYDHAIQLATWINDGLGWMMENEAFDNRDAQITVHAWADLHPY